MSTITSEGGDWTRTEEEAKVVARKMRDRKIANLKKQIAKLQGMDFGGTP